MNMPMQVRMPTVTRPHFRVDSSLSMQCSVRAALLSLPAVAAIACGDPLVAPELIADVRVLAARVESEQDPEQAWVAPEAGARLRWFVVSPDGPPTLGWATWLCPAQPVSRGLPLCAAPNFATSLGAPGSEPDVEFVVPDPSHLYGSTRLNAFAAFCASGTPTLDIASPLSTTSHCPNNDETPLLATFSVPIVTYGTLNHNPAFERVEIRLDGQVWPPWEERPETALDCASLSGVIPMLKAGTSGHDVEINVPTDLSEPLPTLSSHSARREDLSLSHFVTAGDLERAFSAVDLGSQPATTRLNWNSPQQVAVAGQLVRFHVILRDGRSGADWTTRALCVLP